MQSFITELIAFYESYGHTYVSPNENKDLFQFVHNLRRTRPKLDASMISLLESMKFDWTQYMQRDQHWLFMYHKVIAFKKDFGHTHIPESYKEDPKLGIWLATQRRNKHDLPTWRIKLLDDIDFIWDLNLAETRENSWNEMYEKLLAYKHIHGNTSVPSKYSKDPKLSIWVITQRNMKSQMSLLRREKLDRIDFNWGDIIEQYWERQFQELIKFKAKHKHLRISKKDPEWYSLYLWTNKQRREEKKIPDHRKKKLNAIGFRWFSKIRVERNARWNQRYQALVEFYNSNGHCKIPTPYRTDIKLNSWVQFNRLNWANLDENRKKKLEAINFMLPEDIEKELRRNWLLMFQRLRKFRNEFGHCKVPANSIEDASLRYWVDFQRGQVEKMPYWKKVKLEEIGFEWTADIKKERVKRWYEMYKKLESFYKKHGHSRVPEIYEEEPQLFRWMCYQRKPKKPLSIDRLNLLKAVDFAFSPREQLRERDDKGRWIKIIQ